jgi:hypothetical protein
MSEALLNGVLFAGQHWPPIMPGNFVTRERTQHVPLSAGRGGDVRHRRLSGHGRVSCGFQRPWSHAARSHLATHSSQCRRRHVNQMRVARVIATSSARRQVSGKWFDTRRPSPTEQIALSTVQLHPRTFQLEKGQRRHSGNQKRRHDSISPHPANP